MINQLLFDTTLNSQYGPHEIHVRRLEDGTVHLYLPGLTQPITVRDRPVVVSFYCPGPPNPIALRARLDIPHVE